MARYQRQLELIKRYADLRKSLKEKVTIKHFENYLATQIQID